MRIKNGIILIFVYLTYNFYACDSSINPTSKSSKHDTTKSTDSINGGPSKVDVSRNDTLDCLHLVDHLIWKESNYWELFKKNSKNELYGDIEDSETITYLDDEFATPDEIAANSKDGVITIIIRYDDAYAARVKLTPNIHHPDVSTLELDLNKKELWMKNLGSEEIQLKFDTVHLSLIRKCIREKRIE